MKYAILLAMLMGTLGCGKKPEPAKPTAHESSGTINPSNLTLSEGEARTGWMAYGGKVVFECGQIGHYQKGVVTKVHNCRMGEGVTLDELANVVMSSIDHIQNENKEEIDRLTIGWCRSEQERRKLLAKLRGDHK